MRLFFLLVCGLSALSFSAVCRSELALLDLLCHLNKIMDMGSSKAYAPDNGPGLIQWKASPIVKVAQPFRGEERRGNNFKDCMGLD